MNLCMVSVYNSQLNHKSLGYINEISLIRYRCKTFQLISNASPVQIFT